MCVISISTEDVEDGSGYVNSLTSSPSRESTSTELSSSIHSEMAGCDQQIQDQQGAKDLGGGVTIQWTGTLDWTTGLTYVWFLHILWLDLRSLASKHP